MPYCNAELVEQVKQAIKDCGISQKAAAGAMNIAEGTLSQIIGGTYETASIQKMEGVLRTWLDKVQKRQTAYKPLVIKFVPTSISEYVFNITDSCRACKEMGVFVGKAGIGKTASIREYAKQHSDVIVIYADNTMTKHGLFEDLAEALNLNPVGSTNALFKRCKRRLHDGDFCIIVDEAEHLSLDMLDDLRRLADPEVGGCGLLLIGLPKLLITLRSCKGKADYIPSRFFQKEIKSELTNEGVRDICAAAGAVFASWHKQFAKRTHNARKLIKALNMCQRIMCTTEQKTGELCPMGEDVIAEAFEQLVF